MVETTEEGTIDGAGGSIGIKFFVIRRLDARFDGVERVDEQVDREGSNSAREKDVGISIIEGHRTGMPMQGYTSGDYMVVVRINIKTLSSLPSTDFCGGRRILPGPASGYYNLYYMKT